MKCAEIKKNLYFLHAYLVSNDMFPLVLGVYVYTEAFPRKHKEYMCKSRRCSTPIKRSLHRHIQRPNGQNHYYLAQHEVAQEDLQARSIGELTQQSWAREDLGQATKPGPPRGSAKTQGLALRPKLREELTTECPSQGGASEGSAEPPGASFHYKKYGLM